MTSDTGTSERLSDCGIFIDTRSEAALQAAIEKTLTERSNEKLSARITAFSFTHSWDEIAQKIVSAFFARTINPVAAISVVFV